MKTHSPIENTVFLQVATTHPTPLPPGGRGAVALATRWAATFIMALSTASLATPNVPPPASSAPLLITGATLHTVSRGRIDNGRMLVDKGRIVAIGQNEVTAPANAVTLNLAGKHVYPGLIVANSAMGLVEVQAVRATLDTTETGPLNPNVRAQVGINADAESIPVVRANGVLAALSVPRAGMAGLIAGTSSLIHMDGWNYEDMSIAPEVGLHISLPSLRISSAVFPTASAAWLAEMRRMADARLKQLDEAFEAARAYDAARRADTQTPVDARLEAMRAAVRGERRVFIHAEDVTQIRHALGFAERFGLKLVIVGGMDAPLVAPLLKARNVPVILAGVHRLPMRRGDPIDKPFRAAADLAAAGVQVAIARSGTSFDTPMDRSLPFEAATAAAHGLSKEAALRAITLTPAEILGVADQLGSLDAGKIANFYVADGDVLDIRTHVEKIFIKGRDVPLEDKQTRLTRKYEERLRRGRE
jgi:imidazolonepropionase-like amidohydrolase